MELTIHQRREWQQKNQLVMADVLESINCLALPVAKVATHGEAFAGAGAGGDSRRRKRLLHRLQIREARVACLGLNPSVLKTAGHRPAPHHFLKERRERA